DQPLDLASFQVEGPLPCAVAVALKPYRVDASRQHQPGVRRAVLLHVIQINTGAPRLGINEDYAVLDERACLAVDIIAIGKVDDQQRRQSDHDGHEYIADHKSAAMSFAAAGVKKIHVFAF